MERIAQLRSISNHPRRSLLPFPSPQFLIRTIATAVAAAALATSPAPAVERNAYSMELLVNGAPLRELNARGTTYVEAIAGAEYSIRLSNLTPDRVAIALSVDGLNSIDAKSTPAKDARKWILGPWETVTLDGWQTSSETARRFFFTTEQDSYGAWLGKTKNLGIVTAAVFRERKPTAWNLVPKDRDDRPLPAAPAAESAPAARGQAARDASCAEKKEAGASKALSDELAATGIGRELGHQVQRVDFDAEPAPAAVIDLRYEYHDALVRLGVLPAPNFEDDRLARRERSHGFDGMEFAPDPFRTPSHR